MKDGLKVLYGEQSMMLDSELTVCISVSDHIDTQSDKLRQLSHEAVSKIADQIRYERYVSKPETAAYLEKMKAELTGLFPEPIFVEEIENGYQPSSWFFRAQPWFIITTKIGRFRIGWRKRVIHLEWTDTINPTSAEELFFDEDTTKYDRVIHAWTLDKAKSYIEKIIASVLQRE